MEAIIPMQRRAALCFSKTVLCIGSNRVQNTKENLQEAISVETAAYKKRYPEMIKVAKEEGNEEAETFFRYALESERIHAQLMQKFLDTLDEPQENYAYHICSGCGHTVEEEPPEACPVCGGSAALQSDRSGRRDVAQDDQGHVPL